MSVTRISPTHGLSSTDLGELWRGRGMLFVLVWRDFKVRYKQTAVGVAWAVIQPLATMVVFSLLFGRLARMPSDGLPYSIFVFAGLLPWQYFARVLQEGGTSLVTNSALVTKVYFPRMLLPLSSVFASLVDLGIALTVLAIMMFFYGIVPGWQILLLPVFVVVAMMAGLSVALWAAALDAIYRDVRFVIPFLTQIWMFLTPVIYPVSFVPDEWRFALYLNPMAGVVEGFRWCLLNTESPPPALALVLSCAVIAVGLVGALYFFRRTETVLADRI